MGSKTGEAGRAVRRLGHRTPWQLITCFVRRDHLLGVGAGHWVSRAYRQMEHIASQDGAEVTEG